VDDVAQDTFVAIMDALDSFRYESSVLHFAKRIAVRRAGVALRYKRASRRAASATVALDDDDVVESSNASPLEAAIAARQMMLLRQLVTELPEEQGEALLLRVVLGHSAEEIAESTRTPINTVKSRLRAARATLRDRIVADSQLAELEEAAQ
jgi:RNA polymerase sigma-70 factor (ECF subfamily)